LVQLAAAVAPGPAVLGVRSERILIGSVAGMNQMTGIVERTIYAGDTVTHFVLAGGVTTVQVTEPAHGAPPRDGAVTLSFPPSACMVLSA
jgi:hypothetical protein